MFNIFILIALSLFTTIEAYKFVINKSFTNYFTQLKLVTNTLLMELFFILLLFLQLNVEHSLYFYITVLQILGLLLYVSHSKNLSIECNLTIIVCIFLAQFYAFYQNLLVFVFIAELFSIITFFILFFNSTTLNNTNSTSIIYFIISNITTFLWGIVAIVLNLYNLGTLNIYIIQSLGENIVFFNITLVLYLLLKFGQGPAVLFKFRFYRLLNKYDLIFYLFIYVILIWPILTHITSILIFFIDNTILLVLVTMVTITLIYSTLINSSLWDFLVFSTWVLTWYLIIITFSLCLIKI